MPPFSHPDPSLTLGMTAREARGLEALIAMLAERLLQRRDDLADRALVAHAVDDQRHEVRAGARAVVELRERACDVALARRTERVEARDLIAFDALIDRQDRQRRLPVFDKLVHADDDRLFLFERTLRAIRRFADLVLHEARLDCCDRAAHLLDPLDQLARAEIGSA